MRASTGFGLTGVASVAALLLAVSCGREAVDPSSPVMDLLGTGGPVLPSRLLASWHIRSGSSSGTYVGSPPVGAVVCLTHGALHVDLGVPYPQALQGTTFVGCDTLIGSPGRVVYAAANSPHFTEFNSQFTNGVSELVGDFVASTDANLLSVGANSGLGQYECWVVQDVKEIPSIAHGREASCNAHRPQDLSGFTLDSIGLNIEDIQLTTEPFVDAVMWAHLSVKRTWDFYGHRTALPVP